MLLKKEEFLKKYMISEEEFKGTGIEWIELEEIYYDYKPRMFEYERVAVFVWESFRTIKNVHSVKYRVKDPEHLIEKIIRKRIKNPLRVITKENYRERITDLIGIRVLHLFKEEWEDIHEYIITRWMLINPKPKANVRAGDHKEMLNAFEQKGCEIVVHPFGYRSVHYHINTGILKETTIGEIQVRTIFEEAWSEIDHRIRYPYQVNNPILSNYLEIFNRLAGSADEMGSYIRFLNNQLVGMEEKYTKEIEDKNSIITDLKEKIEKLEIRSEEKIELEKSLESLDMRVGNVMKTYQPIYSGAIKNIANFIQSMDEETMQKTIRTAVEVFSTIDKEQLENTLNEAVKHLDGVKEFMDDGDYREEEEAEIVITVNEKE